MRRAWRLFFAPPPLINTLIPAAPANSIIPTDTPTISSPRLAEDQRLARHAYLCTDLAALDLYRGKVGGARLLARDRAAHAGSRDVEMVEGGTARRLSRLQPERQGPHDLLGLFGAPAAGCTRLGAARLGGGPE